MKIFILCLIALLATSISTAEVPDHSLYSNGDGIPITAFESLLRKPLEDDKFGDDDDDAEQGESESSSIIDDAQGNEEDDDDNPSSIEKDDPEGTIEDITATGELLESSESRAGRKARGLRKRARKTLKKWKAKLKKIAQRLPPIGVNVQRPF